MLLTVTLLVFGYVFPTEQYLTPDTGVGYLLGIVGGSAMLLLLIYPARKRVRFLHFLGTTKVWFQVHMALGIVGPLLVLFHSNFSLGATNSNVALVSMLIVSGSGLFGRYFYTQIHHGLHGRKANLAELRAYADRMRDVTTSAPMLPDLMHQIDFEERAIVERSQRLMLLARPVFCSFTVMGARRRLRRHVHQALADVARSGAARAQRQRLAHSAIEYVDDRLSATRRVVEFAAYERLFSLWHALHLPLFVMLLIAGIAHVIAVHVY
jgi:hypothetical protein